MMGKQGPGIYYFYNILFFCRNDLLDTSYKYH